MVKVGKVQIAIVKNMFGNVEVQAFDGKNTYIGMIFDKYQKNIIWKTPKRITDSVNNIAYERAMKLYI